MYNINNKKIIITTSWDDGHELDMKLAGLLKKYSMPATFYIPIQSSKQKVISDINIKKISRDFEIGSHTVNHFKLTSLSNALAEEEIVGGKSKLEKILQHKTTMFCYPFGSYDNSVLNLVKNAGFRGARTTSILSTGYNNNFTIPTTLHAANHPISYYFEQALTGNKLLFLNLLQKNTMKDWFLIGKESLRYVIKHGGIWHLWGHSWEIEKNNDWDKLEELFKIIKKVKKDNPNITLLTNSKII